MNDSSKAGNPLIEYAQLLQETTHFFIRRIRRNFWVMLLIILFCTGAAAALWYRQKPFYESQMVGSYINERFSRKTYGEMVEKLNQLAKSGSYQELGKQLGLKPEQVGGIIALEAKNRAGSPLHEDITGDHQDIYINLRSYDREIFQPAEAALIRYLSGTQYQTDIGKMQVRKLEEKLNFQHEDLQKADSLLQAFMSSLRLGYLRLDSAGRSGPVDLLYYREQLYDKLTSTEQRITLESGPSVLLLHGFSPADRPSRGSFKMVIAGIIIGLLLAFCWAILKPERPRDNG